MRRSFLALFIGLVAVPANAGEMYYQTTYNWVIYAANESTRTLRIALNSTEYPHGQVLRMTRYNHAGSNGQALLQVYPATSAIQLVYRQPNGVVTTKDVTNLGGNDMKPTYPSSLAQDDRFFSFKTQNSTGRFSIWRLNVTVDQALAADYVPPSDYNDPRLQLVVDEQKDTSPANAENYAHTWSPDGTRLAYMDRWANASGTRISSIRVKDLASGSTDPFADVSLRDWPIATNTSMAVIQWSPVSDAILNCEQAGGVWAVHADSPGAFSWIAQNKTSKVGTSTVVEKATLPRWRPDGQAIGFSYRKDTTSRTGSVTTVWYAAEMGANGWPAVLFTGSDPRNEHQTYGWTP
jgi:hypothetical protein